MAEQKESSVLFSLKELMNIEETRIKEEEDAKKRRVEEETKARLDAERRAREEEEARLGAEEERRRQDELRRKMEDAQIEAAKSAEIEKRRLEEQHRLQMEAMAKQQAHERDIHVIQSQKRKGLHPGVFAGLGVLILGLLAVVFYMVSIVPHDKAKQALARAKTEAAGDDEAQWNEADNDLAIAKNNDPTNPDIADVQKTLDDKRAEVKKKQDADAAAKDAVIADLRSKLNSAKTPEEFAALQKQLDAAVAAKPGVVVKPTYNPGVQPVKPKNCHDVPGCPLCPQVCN